MQSKENQNAVPFAIADTGGHTHKLEDSAGRWLLLIFHRHLG